MASPWDSDPAVVSGPWDADRMAAPPAQQQAGGVDTVASDPIARSFPNPITQPVARTGYAAQVARTMAGNGPTGLQPPTETPFDFAKGGAETAITGIPGIPGDTESLVRLGLSPFGISRQTTLPTGGDLANDIFGRPANATEAAGRAVGGFASPSILSKVAGVLALPTKTADALAQAASDARNAGYVLPPNMASNNPSVLSQGLSAVAGKIKTQQAASVKNAQVTDALAARSVGLPEDQKITEDALEGVRATAGRAYEAARNAPIQIIPDRQFATDIAGLDSRGAAVRSQLPGLVQNPELDKLSTTLSGIQQLSPDAAVDAVRSLRYQAQTNLKNYTSPEKMDLGRAQSHAANALETLLERNLQAATTARGPIGAQGGNMTSLVSDLQQARQTIAKTYDVQSALNDATGNVDAQKFAALADKGRPLTGELAQIARTAQAFPKAVQNPAKFGGKENLSVLDAALSLGMEHAGGGPAALAWLGGRPAARSLILSNMYQNRAIPQIASGGQAAAAAPSIMNSPVIRALILQHALAAATSPANAQQ